MKTHPAAHRVGETERLATIARLGMTETSTVSTFDALVDALRMMLDVPAAYVVVIDVDTLKVWSGTGEGTLWSVPRTGSFSDEVVRTGEALVIADARRDPRFAPHPYVSRKVDPLPFFIGIPLATSTGAVLGTLCGFDRPGRSMPDGETIAMLEELATTAVAELELKSANAELAAQHTALLARTEILEATFDNIQEGVTIFDGELGLVAVNRKGAEMLGLPDSIHDDPSTLDLRDAALAGFYGEGPPEEVLASRARRLQHYVNNRPQPIATDQEIPLGDGRTVRRRMRQLSDGFLTTYVDLTEQRRRQAELVAQARYFELQHKLAVLSNASPDLSSALRRIVDLNLRELQGTVGLVWRMQADELVPQGILRLAGDPDATPEAEAALAATLVRPSDLAWRSATTGRIGYVADGEGDRGDLGRLLPAEALRAGYAVPLRVLDEVYVTEFYGAAGVGPRSWHADIVADIETQLDLVAERDRAERRKAEFISTISHELRTPLTSMRGMLELLDAGLFGALPDGAASLIGRAGADSRVLGTLIEDVLAIHDLQHGDVPVRAGRADVGPVLRDAAASGGFALVIDEGADLEAVFDPALLERALAKLATVFCGPDRIARLSARRRGGRMVRIVVEGRAEDGREHAGRGGCVAVRLVSALMERSGGRVVDKSAGERAEIQIDLPVESVRRMPLPAPAEAELPEGLCA